MKKILAVFLVLLVPFLTIGSADVQAVSLLAIQISNPALSGLNAPVKTVTIEFGELLGTVYSPKDVFI